MPMQKLVLPESKLTQFIDFAIVNKIDIIVSYGKEDFFSGICFVTLYIDVPETASDEFNLQYKKFIKP